MLTPMHSGDSELPNEQYTPIKEDAAHEPLGSNEELLAVRQMLLEMITTFAEPVPDLMRAGLLQPEELEKVKS